MFYNSAPLWDFTENTPWFRAALFFYVVSIGWLGSSTFALDHFELFGIKQATGIDIYELMGVHFGKGISTRWHMFYCRHPIMWGFICMFFITPLMTVNHLIFACLMTGYILCAVKYLEEPDLKEMFPQYETYMHTTPAFCPLFKMYDPRDESEKTKQN